MNVSPLRELPSAVPAAIGVVSFTLLLALALFVLGGRAQNAANARPMPNVVGMRVAEARRVLQAKGPVKIRVVRVSYGRAGEVQRVSGFEFDGTYNKATTLVLSVGSRDPNR